MLVAEISLAADTNQ